MNDIRGLYSAVVTPFAKDESVDYGALRALVRNQIDSGVEGFYCCGSSGEGLLLSFPERKRILEAVLDEAGGKVPVLAHVGTIRTRDAVDLARHAESAGATAVSAIPPYYYQFSRDEIISYYEEIIDGIGGDVLIYNAPALTGVSFTKDNSARLFENPRILGIKHTSMNLYDLERIRSAYPGKILFNGHDEQYLPALGVGADAAIGTTIGLFPRKFLMIRSLYAAGQLDEARRYQEQVNKAIEVLVDIGVFPAAKYAFSLSGIDVGECRRPFLRLTDSQKMRVEKVLAEID